MQERFKVNVRRSCRLALLRPSVWYQESEARDQSALRLRIREIAMDRPRFGYLRVLVMLKREGWEVGKKRVYRLYRLEGLQLRMKVKRRKRISLQRGRPTPATGPNQQWSMDFVHDQMLDGRAFRVLMVIDQWGRESVSLEANFRLTGRCVGNALDEAAIERGWPQAIDKPNRQCGRRMKRRLTKRTSLKTWRQYGRGCGAAGSYPESNPVIRALQSRSASHWAAFVAGPRISCSRHFSKYKPLKPETSAESAR